MAGECMAQKIIGVTEEQQQEFWQFCHKISLPISLLPDKVKCVQYSPGEVLLPQGTQQQYGFWVVDGVLRACHYLEDGQERCKEFYFTGELCMLYQSFMSNSPARYQLEALTSAAVIPMELGVLDEPEAKDAKLNLLLRQLQYKEDKEAFLLLNTPEQRYLWLAEHWPHWLINLSQLQLASYIGITPQSLSRIRRRLRMSAPE